MTGIGSSLAAGRPGLRSGWWARSVATDVTESADVPAYLKAALDSSAAINGDAARQGMRVNAVCPGQIDARMILSLAAQPPSVLIW
jgi:NAD(P)-dependent dehydrogenase (short-subunit alcohol dehydrogenase family)